MEIAIRFLTAGVKAAFGREKERARKVFVTVEINLGQVHLEVERCAAGKVPCHLVGHAGGTVITPDEVIAKIEEAF